MSVETVAVFRWGRATCDGPERILKFRLTNGQHRFRGPCAASYASSRIGYLPSPQHWMTAICITGGHWHRVRGSRSHSSLPSVHGKVMPIWTQMKAHHRLPRDSRNGIGRGQISRTEALRCSMTFVSARVPTGYWRCDSAATARLPHLMRRPDNPCPKHCGEWADPFAASPGGPPTCFRPWRTHRFTCAHYWSLASAVSGSSPCTRH